LVKNIPLKFWYPELILFSRGFQNDGLYQNQTLSYAMVDGVGRGVIPGRAKRFSLLYSIQNDSGAHTASYLKGNVGYMLGCKAARA
jgi:hypothetical protein